jgi:hypothetical protein
VAIVEGWPRKREGKTIREYSAPFYSPLFEALPAQIS